MIIFFIIGFGVEEAVDDKIEYFFRGVGGVVHNFIIIFDRFN